MCATKMMFALPIRLFRFCFFPKYVHMHIFAESFKTLAILSKYICIHKIIITASNSFYFLVANAMK